MQSLLVVLVALASLMIWGCAALETQSPENGGFATPSDFNLQPATPTDLLNISLERSLDITYFPVTGTSTQDIFASIESDGPDYDDQLPGHFASGLTKSDLGYEIRYLDRRTSCELEAATITLALVVTLPRHTTPVLLSDVQTERWQKFVAEVEAHEQIHVDIHVERAEAFKSELDQLTEPFSDCSVLEARVGFIWELERQRDAEQQDAFHASEDQLSQMLRAPLQQQIDEYSREITEYQASVDLLDVDITRFQAEIAELDSAMLPYDAEMATIREQYPDLVLPPDVFNRYEQLLTEWNSLNVLRNAVVAQSNATIQRRNGLIEDSNLLAKQVNALNDEMTWLP